MPILRILCLNEFVISDCLNFLNKIRDNCYSGLEFEKPVYISFMYTLKDKEITFSLIRRYFILETACKFSIKKQRTLITIKYILNSSEIGYLFIFQCVSVD